MKKYLILLALPLFIFARGTLPQDLPGIIEANQKAGIKNSPEVERALQQNPQAVSETPKEVSQPKGASSSIPTPNGNATTAVVAGVGAIIGGIGVHIYKKIKKQNGNQN